MSDEDHSLAEERLRLEREALAVERERLAAARARVEEESRLLQRKRRPFLVFASVALLALLSAAGGFIGGMATAEGRQRRERADRLAQALSRIEGWNAASGATNALPMVKDKMPSDAHGGVSVVVIQ